MVSVLPLLPETEQTQKGQRSATSEKPELEQAAPTGQRQCGRVGMNLAALHWVSAAPSRGQALPAARARPSPQAPTARTGDPPGPCAGQDPSRQPPASW